MKLSIVLKILLSIIPVGMLGMFIAVVSIRSLFLSDMITPVVLIVAQVILIGELIYLSSRSLKYGKNREQGILYIVVMVVFWPFVLYYVWFIDDKLVGDYLRKQPVSVPQPDSK